MSVSAALLDIFNAARLNNRSLLVAIDGYSGSGKSTLTSLLQSMLADVAVIHLDDYMDTPISGNSADKEAFNRDRLITEILQPLQTHPPKTATVTIVEGVTSSHPDIAAYFDYKIWVNLPRLTALARAEKRDQGQANFNDAVWREWSDSDRLYFEKYRPDQRADFIYDNN